MYCGGDIIARASISILHKIWQHGHAAAEIGLEIMYLHILFKILEPKYTTKEIIIIRQNPRNRQIILVKPRNDTIRLDRPKNTQNTKT